MSSVENHDRDPSTPQNSKSSTSALTLAKSLASTATNLHDAARELNRSSSPPAALKSSEVQISQQDRRRSSVKMIVQEFEEKLTLERTSNTTADTMSQASSNVLDYSDDDEDGSQSELSFSMDSVNSFNPPGNFARALASNNVNVNTTATAMVPNNNNNNNNNNVNNNSRHGSQYTKPPKAPPSPSSSINNHYISSTEVSPVPWEMMQEQNLSYPAVEEEPQYKLNPKFINVPASSSPPQQTRSAMAMRRSPQKQRDVTSPTLAVQQVRSLLSPVSQEPEPDQVHETQLNSDVSPPVSPTRRCVWQKYKTQDGNDHTYFLNEETGESSWDQPPDYYSPPPSPLPSPPQFETRQSSLSPPTSPTNLINTTSGSGKQSALHIVTSQCSLQGMQLLIGNGADVDSADGDLQTPLHILCSKPKGTASLADCANLLISHSVDVNAVDKQGTTPLHLAVMNGHEGLTSILVAAGSDLAAVDRNGNNALHLAAVVGELGCMQAIVLAQSRQSGETSTRQEEFVREEELVTNNYDQATQEEEGEDGVGSYRAMETSPPKPAPSAWVPCTTEAGNVYYYNTMTGTSSWDNPFLSPEPQQVQEEQQHYEEVFQQSSSSSTTLTASPAPAPAPAQTLAPIASQPVDNGTLVDTDHFTDADDDHGIDALSSPASTTANNDISDNPNMEDTHMAIWNKFFQNAMTRGTKHTNPLISPQNWAKPMEDHDYFEVLGLAFDSNGASDQNSQSAALFASVLRSEIENVEKLVLMGAPATCADKVGRTPLHHACRIGDRKIVAILCDYGADVDFTDSQGNSPLHIAAVRGVESVLRFLLETAAQVHIQNKNGDSPLHLAVWHGNRPCCKSLLEYSADVDAKNGGGLNCFDNVMARSPMAYRMPKALYKTMAFIDELLRSKGIRTLSPLPLPNQGQPQQTQAHHAQQSLHPQHPQQLQCSSQPQQQYAPPQQQYHHQQQQLQQQQFQTGYSQQDVRSSRLDRPRSPMSDTNSITSSEGFHNHGSNLPPPPPPPLQQQPQLYPSPHSQQQYSRYSQPQQQQQQQQFYARYQVPPQPNLLSHNPPLTSSPRNSSPSDLSQRSSSRASPHSDESTGGANPANTAGVWGAVATGATSLFGKLFSGPATGQPKSEFQSDLAETMSQSSYNSKGSGNLTNLTSMLTPAPPPPPRSPPPPPPLPPPTDREVMRSRNNSLGSRSDSTAPEGILNLSRPPLDVQVALAQKQQITDYGQSTTGIPEDVQLALNARLQQQHQQFHRQPLAPNSLRSRYVDTPFNIDPNTNAP
ncbi:hypothetical protein TrVE_jg8211 [Triparma verrucosa]|uniref:WW domain-containing protein n=1 Tax=Triparma verrucosa TaxID=1606542 RepID=A0A9W7CDT3_9STRA|nr:hypothetical protein TrVE_jg8211 [Triparma verrucosa]